MADSFTEELRKRVGASGGSVLQTNAPAATPSTNVVPFADELRSRLSQQGINAPPSSVAATPNLGFQEREGRRGEGGELIPIDLTSGIGLGEYSRIAEQRDPESKLAVLKNMYPNRKSRILDSGEITLEVLDSKTGKPKDVMINPAGINAHDLMDLAVQAPEIAVGIATAVATKGRGFLKTAGQIILSSLSSAGAGAARDVAARGAEGIPIRPGEIATAQGGNAALDMFLQAGGGVASKALGVLSPFARDIKPGSLEFDLQQGTKFMEDAFGENIRRTPAEITGSLALGAVEAAETKQPGARNVMARIKEMKDAALQRIQGRAVGKVTPEEKIGESAIGTLRDKVVLPIEESLTAARTSAETKGQQRVLSLIDDAIGMPQGARISPSMAGVKTLEQFESKLANAEKLVDEAYAKVNELPGGTGDVLSGSAASKAAAEIRKELPQVNTTKEKVAFDQYGNPRAIDVPSKEILKSGVPEGLLKALDDLESLKGGKVSLQTLTNMKRAAYDEIAKTEAVPGVKERWFNKIAKAYEQGIQAGIDETGDPALKAALTNAKDTYKKELLPFDRPGIKEMAKGEFDTARLSPEQITKRLFEGPKAIENYAMLQDVLGVNNPAFRVLKRSFVDTQLANVTDRVTGSVDAKGLADLIDDMHVNKPELAKELFGKHDRELTSALRFQMATQKLDSLDAAEVKTLMSLKDPSRADLAALMAMQKNRNAAYSNDILKDIADGLTISDKIKPTEFVKRIRNTSMPEKDVRLILDTLVKENPEARNAIATAEFYRLLDKASITEASTAVRSLGPEPLNLSGTALAEAIGRQGSPQRLRTELLLGSDPIKATSKDGLVPPKIKQPTRLDVLKGLVQVLAPGEVAQTAFGAAGGIAGGQAVLQAAKKPLTYVPNFIKKLFLATAYTSDIGAKLIANRVYSPAETAVIANTIIASEPFIRRVTETLGPEQAREAIGIMKDSIDQFVTDLKNARTADTPENRQRNELEKLQQGQPARVRIQ